MLVVRNIFIALMLLSAGAVSGQNMRQMWMDMPDERVPYLNRSNRTELADYVEMKVDAAIRNKLGDTTRVESLTADYMRVALNAATRMEMRLLKRVDGEPVLCVVTTYLGPAADSRVAFFDTQWQPLTAIPLPQLALEQLVGRPEGMEADRYADLLAMLEPQLTELRLAESEPILTATCSIPIASRDDLADLQSILRTVIMRWDGREFTIQ